jgi:deoxyribodipyrimidine photo-lyase
MTASSTPILYWHRQDLRLADNPALTWAAQRGAVIPIYILHNDPADLWPMGDASKWWLHHALESLRAGYTRHGVDLILRHGEPLKILTDLATAVGAKTICWNRCYEPHAIARDKKIKDALQKSGHTVESHNSALLFEPWTIKTGSGGPYRVFTPYYRACLANGQQHIPLPEVKKLLAIDRKIHTDELEVWNLLPTEPDWAAGMRAAWQPDEAGAHKRLQNFIDEGVNTYKTLRDRPDLLGTSRLSPYLHFGEISPRQIWQTVTTAIAAGKINSTNAEAYLRQLIWREFSTHLLYHAPTLPDQPLQQQFRKFPWHDNAKGMRAWQRGQTGYPIVDAGMRELWQTGWMHNRVRMIVASFLVKDLLLPWQDGERWFWNTLVDADLANNAAGWQWVAGCGADAAPYYRIFNPVLQGTKFDPQGDYVRQYLPELKNMPTEHIHAPWLAPDTVFNHAGVQLGKNYPRPIVDHAVARDRALAALKTIKAS